MEEVTTLHYTILETATAAEVEVFSESLYARYNLLDTEVESLRPKT